MNLCLADIDHAVVDDAFDVDDGVVLVMQLEMMSNMMMVMLLVAESVKE